MTILVPNEICKICEISTKEEFFEEFNNIINSKKLSISTENLLKQIEIELTKLFERAYLSELIKDKHKIKAEFHFIETDDHVKHFDYTIINIEINPPIIIFNE